MEAKGILKAKAGNGKGFLLDNDKNWFNANNDVVPFLAKIEKGTEVEVTYEKVKMNRNVSKIVAVTKETAKAESASTAGYVCEDCGATLKDGKYKKCFMCNKKAPAKEEKSAPKATSYNSPERDVQIRRGNALNAGAASLSGNMQGNDADTIAEMTIVVAEKLLNWLENA